MFSCQFLLITSMLLYLLGSTDSQTLHTCTSQRGQQCNLDCETPDQTVTVSFTDPTSAAAGSCLSNGVCGSGISGYSVARVNSTFTRLTISALDCTRDNGYWRCSHGSNPSALVLLPCLSPRTDIGITANKLPDGGANVTCTSKCQFPVSAYSSLSIAYSQNEKETVLNNNVSAIVINSTTDGCLSYEQNVILSYEVSESAFCGDVQFRCTFDNIYLQSNSSDLSDRLPFTDNTWFIILGWILGILIFALVAFLIILAIARKDLTCMLKEWILKWQFGLLFGIAVVLALIICIIIGVLVCWSSLGQAVGVGIGISVLVLIICVGLIYNIIFCNCLKGKEETPKSSENTARSASPADEANRGLKSNQVSPKKNELKQSDDKKEKAVGVATPIRQDNDKQKGKALDGVPQDRPLPSPKKADNEHSSQKTGKVILPPIYQDQNEESSSSTKKKKKKKKSKEKEQNENES